MLHNYIPQKRTHKERQLSGNATGTHLATNLKLHDRNSEVTKKPRTSDSAPKPKANVKRTADQSIVLLNGSTGDSLAMLLIVQGWQIKDK